MPIRVPLKIFVDGYLLNKEHQGTKTYLRELYKELASQNASILIYFGCFKDFSIQKEFSDFKNIKFLFYKEKSRLKRMLIEIPEIIEKNQFNFAHFQYVIPFKRSETCKYIVTIHDILFNDFKQYFSFSYRIKRNFLFRYSAKKSDYLITVSNYSKERIEKHYRIKKKTYVTPNGVNKAFFKPYDKQQSIDYIYNNFGIKNYILYVSRIEPRKNQQTLLKVFSELKNNELQLVFIGVKTINNQEFNKQYGKLSKKDKIRVHLLEDISDQDLLEFYKAAKLFVYPTLAEGFGIPPLEAAAFNTPVLCSNLTAMSDFLFFKPYHINFNENETIKNSLLKVLEDKNLNLNKIKKQIEKKYSWSNSAKILGKLINEI